jgi:hypothetical protein
VVAVAYSSGECLGFGGEPSAWGSQAGAARRVEAAPRVADARRAGRPASTAAATFRRRRMVALAVLVAATAVIAGLVLGGAPRGSGEGPLAITGPTGELAVQPAVAHVYVVRPGDTIWSIVEANGVRGDPRPVVDRLEAEVKHQPLQVGQRLVLP